MIEKQGGALPGFLLANRRRIIALRIDLRDGSYKVASTSPR
jgi:hypothetical protein